MSIKFVLEGIKFVLQFSRFLLLRVNKDVLDWSQLISHKRIQRLIHTHPTFQPSPNKVNHFFHEYGKPSDSTTQLVWDWNFLEPAELARERLDAICKAFHCFIGSLLSLQMLQKSLVMLWTLKTEKEPTLYTTSIQESTACVTGFSCFKLDNIQEYYSTINHLADCGR